MAPTAHDELAGYLEDRRVAAEREVDRLRRELEATRNALDEQEAYLLSVTDAINHHRTKENA